MASGAPAGAAASAPAGGRKAPYSGGLQVIGTGLGRTGTSSLKAALEILYDGAPCYHMTEVIGNGGPRGHFDFWTAATEVRRGAQRRAKMHVPTRCLHFRSRSPRARGAAICRRAR